MFGKTHNTNTASNSTLSPEINPANVPISNPDGHVMEEKPVSGSSQEPHLATPNSELSKGYSTSGPTPNSSPTIIRERVDAREAPTIDLDGYHHKASTTPGRPKETQAHLEDEIQNAMGSSTPGPVTELSTANVSLLDVDNESVNSRPSEMSSMAPQFHPSEPGEPLAEWEYVGAGTNDGGSAPNDEDVDAIADAHGTTHELSEAVDRSPNTKGTQEDPTAVPLPESDGKDLEDKSPGDKTQENEANWINDVIPPGSRFHMFRPLLRTINEVYALHLLVFEGIFIVAEIIFLVAALTYFRTATSVRRGLSVLGEGIAAPVKYASRRLERLLGVRGAWVWLLIIEILGIFVWACYLTHELLKEERVAEL